MSVADFLSSSDPEPNLSTEAPPSDELVMGPDPDGALERQRRQKYYLVLLSSILLVCVIVLAAANVWLSVSARVEPFFVAVNEDSKEVVDARPVSQTKYLSDDLVQTRLQKIIRGFREVYSDPRATRKQYEMAWRHVLPESKADSWLRKKLSLKNGENPTDLVGQQQRSVTDLEITKVEGTRTWQLTWAEEHTTENGAVREVLLTGSVSTTRVDLDNEAALKLNPLGLFVDGITWNQTESEVIKRAD